MVGGERSAGAHRGSGGHGARNAVRPARGLCGRGGSVFAGPISHQIVGVKPIAVPQSGGADLARGEQRWSTPRQQGLAVPAYRWVLMGICPQTSPQEPAGFLCHQGLRLASPCECVA